MSRAADPSQALLLTSQATLYLQLYADEATRSAPSYSYLLNHASRVLERAAELYTHTLAAQGRAAARVPDAALDKAPATPWLDGEKWGREKD